MRTSTIKIRTPAGAIVLLLLALADTCGAQYEAVILHSQLVPFPQSYGRGIAGGQQVGDNVVEGGLGGHAMLWSGTASSLVDLHPAGFDGSHAFGVSGGRQVGFAEVFQPLRQSAILWFGSASNYVNLDLPSFEMTRAYGIGGDEQVGDGLVSRQSFFTNALLWRGSTSSAVNLHPAGYQSSKARATDGVQQVGWVNPGPQPNAALWQGTASSFVNLHPPTAVDYSLAYGVGSGQQVGSADAHATLWFGTAASSVDLDPGWGGGSVALATNGSQQVGIAYRGLAYSQAVVWSGSAQSHVGLHDFLPAAYQGGAEEDSEAIGIDAEGNIVGWARELPSMSARAVLWRPIPEPASALTLTGGLALLALLRRKRARLARRNGRTTTIAP